MSTPEQPSSEDILARTRAAAPELAAVLDEPQLWEPIWKRPRAPKNDRDKKQELRKQRRRLQDGTPPLRLRTVAPAPVPAEPHRQLRRAP